jgi:hypothetical protein
MTYPSTVEVDDTHAWSNPEQATDTPEEMEGPIEAPDLAPDWNCRPWGRPSVHLARNENSPHLIATCEFKYHNLRVRGVRLYKRDDDSIYIAMPQKKYGDFFQSLVYFTDQAERELLQQDLGWLYVAAVQRRGGKAA